MAKYKNLLWVILSLTPLFGLDAQVNVVLHHPPPNQLKVPDLWFVELFNSTKDTPTVYLHAEVTEAKEGLIFRANSNDFKLPPGKTSITHVKIKEVKDINYLAKYEAYIRQTNEFPDGTYRICISVMDKKTGAKLGDNCIDQNVRKIGQIRLISPPDGSVVKEDYPLYTWTPPSGLPSGEKITYEIKIAEILTGQTKEEAIGANIPWFTGKGITTTSFRYPISAKALEKGKHYAWQVSATLDGILISRSHNWEYEYYTLLLGKIMLRLPKLGEDITTPYPTFVWAKPQGTKYLEYALTMFEADTSSQPIDYSKLKPFFRKTGIKDTTYTYSEKDPPLKEGKAYIWLAEAKIDQRIILPDSAYIFWYSCFLRDFGDAPDGSCGPAGTYPTCRLNNGARHLWLWILWRCDTWNIWPLGSITICWPWWLWFIPQQHQAWLGTLPAGYNGNPGAPGTIPDCSCHNPAGCSWPNKIDFERDAKFPDNFDNGVYFFPASHYCEQGKDSLDVMVQMPCNFDRSQHLYLQAWFDWNNNGTWTDVSEAILWTNAVAIWAGGGVNPTIAGLRIDIDPSRWHSDTCCAIYRLYFTKNPAAAVSQIWTRFRLFVGPPPTPEANNYVGGVASGEVEDYMLPCKNNPPSDSFDYGDAPDESDAPGFLGYHYCSHKLPGRISPLPWTSFQAARHRDFTNEWLGNIASQCDCSGLSADAETDAKTVNLDLFDDGVSFSCFHIPYNPCDTECVDVLINTSGNTARYTLGRSLYLHAWFDWNRDGDWDDTHICNTSNGTVPADEHAYWIDAQSLCPTPDLFTPVHNYGFKIDPTSWPGWPERKCQMYRLRFLAGTTALSPGGNVQHDTLWCRFRLSYDDNGSGANIAILYHEGVPFGEVEDYPLTSNHDGPGSCQCSIEKIYLSDHSLVNGDAITIPSGSTPNIDVVANCGSGCSITLYEWDISNPAGAAATRNVRQFSDYSFASPGRYTLQLIVHCSDGSTCSWTIYVDVT
jgi:hypothetical protein